MKSFEIVIAIVGAVVALLFLPMAVKAKTASDGMETYAESGLDKMCSDISADNKLDTVRIGEFTQLLMDCGYTGEFKITVYTYENAVNGSVHRYTVEWEEMLGILETEGIFVFPEDCYIRVEVPGVSMDNILLTYLFGRAAMEKPVILGNGM